MAEKSFGIAVTVATNAVGELTDVNLTGVDVNMIDITNHGSSGGYKEFLGGLKDGGSLDLSGNFDEADVGQEYIRDNPGVSAAVVVTLSNGDTISFSAICGAYNVSNPLDDKITFSTSLKITGAVTYAAAI